MGEGDLGRGLAGLALEGAGVAGDVASVGREVLPAIFAGVGAKTADLMRRQTRGDKKNDALRKGSLYTPSLSGLDEPIPGAAFTSPARGAFDVQARAAVDDEGRALRARYVVGRGLGREAERSLAADEVEALVRGLTGNDPQYVPRSQIKNRADGSFSPGENLIRIADDLDTPFIPRTLRHEAGHMLDRAVGLVKDDGIRKELDFLFKEGSTRRGTKGAYTPRDAGYPEHQVRDERIAEAIRIYMEHPAYIKQVAPKAAARIRELFNDHPRVAEWIQFNGIAGLFALGGGASLAAMEGQPTGAQEQQ